MEYIVKSPRLNMEYIVISTVSTCNSSELTFVIKTMNYYFCQSLALGTR